MKPHVGGVVWRLAIFLTVCVLGLFGLLATFAQLRFGDDTIYNADFSNVGGLEEGNFVRIAGVEVGKVKKMTMLPGAVVAVEFSTDPSVVLTEGARAVIRYDNLIGGRFVELEEGAGATKRLNPGGTIPLSQTAPALDMDALIGGFRPLFRALNPDQVNALTGQLIKAFEGQGDSIGSLLSQTAVLTSTLANRDQLIGEVITNLNTVLGSLGDQSDRFDKAVDSLSELVKGLAERKTDIVNGVAYSNAAAGTIADLLNQARPPFANTVRQSDRVGALVVADHDWLDSLINDLPEKYQKMGRLGLYGDYFSYYVCDIALKFNGKGGNPVYVKVAGQTTGRCAPK
jgi:phospholipid/cholesterol/gamma-HCH transport system substrate-binding protein